MFTQRAQRGFFADVQGAGTYVCPNASGREGLREAHGGAKRAKHRAKRSPECADPNVVRGTP